VLVDTHAHLYLPAFDGDRDSVIANGNAQGVRAILQPAIDAASVRDALALCDRYAAGPVRLYAMAAIHPTSAQGVTEADLAEIAALCDDPRVVAVGESGLDFYWDTSYVGDQVRALRFHARLAAARDLPLVLHLRDRKGSEDGARELVRVLREERAALPVEKRLRGVFHCFGGPPWLAADVLDLGFHVGLGGTLTYRNGGVPEATADVPLDRIVLETDAPYLAPAPHRGKRNEPAYVRLVAEKLAEVRGLRVEEVEAATTRTAADLFGLALDPL
jgi:TatD DNase family protein